MKLSGLTTHNLRIPELELPERALIVVTGPSGSGKSSLAFDTIAREARRRYLLALSLTEEVRLPSPAELEEARGLPPAVALPQRIPPRNPRITLGTVTGILERLRRLAAELGESPCPGCGETVRVSSISEVLRHLEGLPEGIRLLITAPLRETSSEALSYLMGEGFGRFYLDGQIYDLTEETPPPRIERAEVVVDRLVKKRDFRLRALEALRLAERLSGGPVALRPLKGEPLIFTLKPRCPYCLTELPEFGPEDFSFNHPRGACGTCGGLGEVEGETCPECRGLRLRPEALRVRLFGRSLAEILSLELEELGLLFENAPVSPGSREFLRAFLEELSAGLSTLKALGLARLTLLSPFHRLSTGERKRVELAGLLAHRLSGTLFVFDEPGLGLSPAEKEKLLFFLKDLVFGGNTVLLVEHDPLFVQRADLVVELGPGAGSEGGRLLFVGPPEELAKRPDLPTGAFLSGKKRLKRTFRPPEDRLSLEGFPALWKGGLTVLCGVSGSGKTRLLERLAETLARKGLSHIFVCGELPGKPRGMVASFLGVFDQIRELFSATPEARALGLSPGHFSPFSPDGRCPYCRGEGRRLFRISGVVETEIPCEECQGYGLKPEALKVTYRGFRLPEILDLSLEEARSFFARVPGIAERLHKASAKGLGYLRLGQSLKSLSGGEKLRLRLTRELLRRGGADFLLLDLPSMGLHLSDLERLLLVLEDLLREGRTLVLAENQPLLVLLADEIWVLEEGRPVFVGPPEKFLASEHPLARELRPYTSLVEMG